MLILIISREDVVAVGSHFNDLGYEFSEKRAIEIFYAKSRHHIHETLLSFTYLLYKIIALE